MGKKVTAAEKEFTNRAGELARNKKSVNDFDIEKAALEIVGYFQYAPDLFNDPSRVLGGERLRQIRGMVYLILEELEYQRGKNGN